VPQDDIIEYDDVSRVIADLPVTCVRATGSHAELRGDARKYAETSAATQVGAESLGRDEGKGYVEWLALISERRYSLASGPAE